MMNHTAIVPDTSGMTHLSRVSVWHAESAYKADLKTGKYDNDSQPEIWVSETRAEKEGLVDALDAYRYDDWKIFASTRSETEFFEGFVEDWSSTKSIGGRTYRVLLCEQADLPQSTTTSSGLFPP